MRISDIITGSKASLLCGEPQTEVSAICCDSRKAVPGSLFIAVKGTAADGRSFVGDALARGAAAAVETDREGLARMADIFYGHPSRQLRLVGITGTNGKTTTTLLTYHILQSAGLNVGLAGNVGKSLALQVATEHHDVYVIELSSFQLDNMYEFKANVAVIMNITPDHLDRYDYKMENYVAAKFRITQNQTKEDSFIFWEDDPIIAAQLKNLKTEAKLLPFSEFNHEDAVAYTANNRMVIDCNGEKWDIDRDSLSLKGLHNLYNSMAAALSASILDIKKETIRKALADFQAVEHRLEYVATINGVKYVNDSKATNVNSCWYALESVNQPTVLILGGKDKGNDYTEIEKFVKEKVKAIVCLGVDNTKLHAFFDGKVPTVVDAGSMQEAVDKCAALASEGDVVLLSPCCASFDLFKSYEDRGTQFKECVKKMQ